MINMKIKFLLTILFFITSMSAKINDIEAPKNKNKILNQAHSLKKNGLVKEALVIYKNLFTTYPYSYDIYESIKQILINEKKLEELNETTERYIIANNNNLKSMIDVFDVFILLEKEIEIELILSELINNFPNNKKSIKIVLKILLDKKLNNKMLNTINQIREKQPDFFSLELGMHYSISMMVEKSLNEFFIYLDNNPKKREFVFNRILAMPDLEFILTKTKTYLIESNNINARLLLSKIEFKQKNYLESYKLILEYKNQENYFIKFVEDLIKVKQFELAQKVIKDILESNFNEKNIEKTILLLAQVFEDLLIDNNYKLLITNSIQNNEILNSPFKKINADKSMLLNKAITIYDSLRISTNQIKPLYHLAEINYKILADFDNADILYNQIINMGYNKYYEKSIERIIDIMISKGDLNNALNFIKKNINIIQKDELQILLTIKKIQILYYINNLEELNNEINKIMKKRLEEHPYYNDILKISYDVLLFSENINFKKYTLAMHKVFQNKRVEAINILETILNTDNVLINNKMKFDCAYLYLHQGNTRKSIELINSIDANFSFNEESSIFEAEIYDYIIENKSKAAELYLLFLDKFKTSIYYELVRTRLRELAG